MAPQDDLTAEHRKRLEKAIGDMLETDECLDIFDRAVRQARQEALREAANIVRQWCSPQLSGDSMHASNGVVEAVQQLDRLASEGAPAPIDLLPKLKDDGGYGEHF